VGQEVAVQVAQQQEQQERQTQVAAVAVDLAPEVRLAVQAAQAL
jgi:hypothetical protein